MTEVLAERAKDALGAVRAAAWLGAGESGPEAVGAARAMAPDSALLALLRVDPTAAIRTGANDPRSLVRWLPEADREWLAKTGAGLVVPLPAEGSELLGVLAIVPSSSERFTDEQVAIAEALAASAALALRSLDDRPGRAVPEGEPAAECVTCGTVDVAAPRCTRCGAETRPAPIPRELNGRFRVERVLGRGGMGVVYLGVDLALEREVALKTLPRVRSDALSRLRGEALSMARFVDPHLALIFGLESWRGVPVLVVEYLAGGTLAARIGPPHPIDAVVRWGIQLASGLESMHEQGLLHRDVKPSNVGFTEQGHVKLLDFGLARLTAELDTPSGAAAGPDALGGRAGGGAPPDGITTASRLIGTPAYLSPEALAGEPPSVAQDLWALGIVLWEAVTGRRPFGSGAVRRPPASAPDLRRARPDCPPELAELLGSALLGDAASRPDSARAMRTRLEAIAGAP
jgi:hypothetical protein